MYNKSFVISLAASLAWSASFAQEQTTVKSPDEKLCVTLDASSGSLTYSVSYDGKDILLPSAMGLETNIGVYGKDLQNKDLHASAPKQKTISYDLDRIKRSHVELTATEASVSLDCAKNMKLGVQLVVENNAVAFRYTISKKGDTGSMNIKNELTEFRFPSQTLTYLTPQSDAMIGWKRTKPSYEEEYELAQPMDKKSKYGHGYTFPCLFNVVNNGWALISETGVTGRYCGSRLSDFSNGSYSISNPMAEENNGYGTPEPAIALPGATPWRTISIGNSAAVAADQTITWDVVEQQYEPSMKYEYGKGTWSWILWQDNSINYKDQIAFVDFAHAMGYKYTLVDSFWDSEIGYKGMEQLAEYAKAKNVQLFVWYSSSGFWNDIVQSPINVMDRAINRKAEMKWLKKIGAAGIKVDFFGGDKQETMRLYEDILSDANDAGLMVVFHGTTMPRGWERMYPNYVGSEAVLASENLIFEQHYCDVEATATALHPFIRNAAGCMEFGGSFMNRHMRRDNKGGRLRKTTDVFEIAQAVLFQNPVQFFALAPNNLTDAPAVCMDFLRDVPTTWTESKILAGDPGRYVVMARRSGNFWYIAGVNATDADVTFDLTTPFKSGEKVTLYQDDKENKPAKSEVVMPKKNKPLKLTIKPNGGVVVVGE